MKKLLIITLLSATFLSCKKEEVVIADKPTEIDGRYMNLFYGKVYPEDGEMLPETVEWLLVGGTVYMENLKTGYKVKYNHFGENRDLSSLRLNGIYFEMEGIEKMKTKWEFQIGDYGTKEFVLNDDTENPYGFEESTSFRSIVEHPQANASNMQLGGSSRSLQVTVRDYDQGQIDIRLQETVTSIDGYNWSYFTVLTFKLVD